MSENNTSESPSNKSNIIKISVIIIISLFLVWFLLTRITIDDVKNVFSEVKPIYIILGLIFYSLSYVFRALRFYFLLNKKVKFKDLLIIVFVHNMMNTILPARTGELSYIYLLKKHKIPLEDRIATLALARIFDFIIIACFLITAILFLRDLPMVITSIFWVVALCMIILIIILTALLYYTDSFKNSINRFAVKLKINRFKTTNRMMKVIEDTIMSFKKFKSQRILLKNSVISLSIWIILFITYYFFIRAFRIELSFIEIVVTGSFITFLPILPIYGAGGFGTTEGAITIIMVAFGIAESHAIVASFGIHIIGFIYIIILGSIAALLLGLKRNTKKL
ncbi:MAG: flippase-like domain-containing protein [Thermoplasmata archaeon]|nr:MAG: flippase-like domain-containing protein [Thermoplasmata archaeon]